MTLEFQITNQYNEQNEQALLGAVLQKNSLLDTITIKPEQFYFPKHKAIYKTMKNMYQNGIAIDTVTLCAELEEDKKLTKVGGGYLVTDLYDACPAPSSAPTYARQIVELWKKRERKKIGQRIVQNGADFDAIEALQELDNNFENQALSVLSLSEIKANPKPLPDMLIYKGLLITGGILIVSGAPKVGKSILAQNLALSLASGIDWFKFNIQRPVRTLIIQAEVLDPFYEKRILMMAENAGFKINMQNLIVATRSQFDITTDEGFAILRQTIIKHNPKVCIIDPLVNYHSFDENDNSRMAEMMGKIRELAEMTAFIVVHHSKKDSTESPVANVRGASAITGSVDSIIDFQKTKSGKRKITFDLRYGATPEDLFTDLDPKSLWFLEAPPEFSEAVSIMWNLFENDELVLTKKEAIKKYTNEGGKKSSAYHSFNTIKPYLNEQNGNYFSKKSR